MSNFSSRKLPSLSNVTAGSTATLEVPIGFSYNAIHFEYSGVTLEQLENLEVKINGKVLQSFANAKQLEDFNKYYNRNTKTGVFTLWFETPEFENTTYQRMTAFGTEGVSTFQISMDIDGAATNPVINAYAMRSGNLPLGAIIKVKRFHSSLAAAGIKEIDNIPKEARIKAIHIFKSDCNKAEVEVSSTVFYDFNKTLGAEVQKDYGRVPDTANMTTVDFTLHGDPFQALLVQGANDFRVRADCASPGGFEILVEYASGFKGI